MTPEQINNLIQQLLKTGEIMLTIAFKIAMRQVYSLAILDGAVAVICFILIAVIYHILSKYVEDEGLAGFLIVIGVIIGIVGLINSGYVLMYLLNPEWYAIQLIITNIVKY